ncbi:MAG: hypothetical protein AAFO04_27660 [Cyanobacteria bacterium J06592_8]
MSSQSGFQGQRNEETGQFQPIGEEPLDRTIIGAKLPKSYSERIKNLPNKSEWVRRVLCEAIDREYPVEKSLD